MPSTEQLSRYAKQLEALLGDRAVAALLPRRVDVEQFVRKQQPSGAFVLPRAHVHPEVRWFEELVILHHVEAESVATGKPHLQSAVRKSVEYCIGEIQPDHATTEPWGLLAFIQYAPILADQVLHAVAMQYPAGPSGQTLSVLADVLYGLRLLMSETR